MPSRSRTAHLTDPAADTAAVSSEAAPTFDLSIRQLLASACAAVTAAILGSRLGVAGTLIGAALASATTMIASAVYSHSLAAAQYRVRQARIGQHLEAEAPTVAIPASQQAWGLTPVYRTTPPVLVPTMPVMQRPAAPARRRLPRWAAAGIGALAVCAIALLTVTGIEAVRGTPLSGGDNGGLSVLGGKSVGTPDTTSTRTPAGSTPAGTSTESTTSSVVESPTTVTSTVTVTPDSPVTQSSSTTSSTSTSSTSSSPSSSSATSTTSSADATADQSVVVTDPSRH